ncbi:SusF/SusE family outer membrane protein [Fulvivirga lutea]|uniref:SusE domain-containing protein n=1 Tax=Fulvivirga lutea TaxID=2810512 RepID=A0A974WE04_9BACT|nr:SusE domain-containing protein [Fulvivirga lutea]QSE96241.1 SusE domain-containing protein [Fulvivirga lutea]
MKINICLFLIAGFFFIASCSEEEIDAPVTGKESLDNFSLIPVEGTIDVSLVEPDKEVIVSWTEAVSGLNSDVTYTWVAFDESGSITNPALSIPSDNEGLSTQLTFTNSQLDDALSSLGVAKGQSVTFNWNVIANNGDYTLTAETSTVTLERGEDGMSNFFLISPSDGAGVSLISATPDEIVEIIWQESFVSTGGDITYEWQADADGGDFDTPLLTLPSNNSGVENYLTLTFQQLEDALADVGIDPGATAMLDWRVVATSGNFSSISNVYSVSITRYLVEIPQLFLVGDATAAGWDNNNNNPALFRDPVNTGKFYYKGYFNAGAFKILEVKGQWQPQWGSVGDGILGVNDGTGSDPGTINVSSAGYYEFVFNGATRTYTFEPVDITGSASYTTVAIIGSATPNGWNDPDTDMVQSTVDSHIWFITSESLVNGEMKFRANDGWDVNWGSDTAPYGQGSFGGPNIPVTEATYTIWFNDLDGRYALIEE